VAFALSTLKLSRLPGGDPEIFESIQGDGVSMGIPSVFVRLSICNLGCSWCDTAYTWDWSTFDPRVEIEKLEVDEVLSRVLLFRSRNTVITGGEPLLQMSPLEDLAGKLDLAGRRIEVETNGTVRPSAGLSARISQWNVSPKLAHSGNKLERREKPAALRWFARATNAFFKFVISDPSDLDEVDAFVERYAVPPERVLLMPEGRDAEVLARRSEWLPELCIARGFRYTTRVHVLLWAEERGR
jgi:7-carboxy-7-deazaguanine synthase